MSNMILASQKLEITQKLRLYCDRHGSQNKAANTLKGISSATISQLLNQNWDLITDEMWRNLASQIGWNQNTWEVVQTRDYKLVTKLLTDAQDYSNVFAITGEAGSGKSVAVRQYADGNKNAYLLCCNEYWNRKFFLTELLTAMGRDYSGLTVAEMMQEAVQLLKKQSNPILIMDEADKLSDQVLYFFITIYNQLEDNCGIVMCATDHLSKRIRKGLKLNKKGYKEIYSRIGRKFIELKGVSSSDITQICLANGIQDKKKIRAITEDSEMDLRRVKRKIHTEKKIMDTTAS